MYMHIYMCIYMHICIYIHTYIHTYIHVTSQCNGAGILAPGRSRRIKCNGTFQDGIHLELCDLPFSRPDRRWQGFRPGPELPERRNVDQIFVRTCSDHLMTSHWYLLESRHILRIPYLCSQKAYFSCYVDCLLSQFRCSFPFWSCCKHYVWRSRLNTVALTGGNLAGWTTSVAAQQLSSCSALFTFFQYVYVGVMVLQFDPQPHRWPMCPCARLLRTEE